MKVLIVSDTHNSNGNFYDVIEAEQPIDMIIHLGDGEGVEEELPRITNVPMQIVRGNNDFFSRLPRDKEFFLGDYHVFITHGNAYMVSATEDYLINEAKGRGADIVMYGHTHKPSIKEKDGIIILNPGSLTYPRQEKRVPSYIVMTLENGVKPSFEIKYKKN